MTALLLASSSFGPRLKVTVLDEGKMLFEGTVDEVQRNEKVIEVYLGHDKKDSAKQKPKARTAALSAAN